MKTQNLFIALLTIVLSTSAIKAEDKPAQEFSNTRYAYVDLRITADPKVFPMGITADDTERLSDIMSSPEVLQSAAEEILETSDAYGKEQFLHTIKYIPTNIGGLQIIRVQLSVSLKDKHKPAAKEFLEAYIQKLKSALNKEHDFGRDLYYNKLRSYAGRVFNAENRLQSLQEEQSKISSGTLDKESVRQRILEHERAIIESSMQGSILKRRADILSRQMSEMKAETKNKLSQLDELTSDLKKLLSQQKENLAGIEPLDSDPEFKDKVVAMKIQSSEANQQYSQMLQRNQYLQNRADEDMQELNRQLRETTMRLEELEIEKTVLYGYSPGSLSDSMKYEMLEAQIEAAKENLKRALIESDEIALQIDLLQQPTVSYDKIVSGKTVPKCD